MIQLVGIESDEFRRGFNAAMASVQQAAEQSSDTAANEAKLRMHTEGLAWPTPDEQKGCLACGTYLVKTGIALWLAMHG